MAPAIVTIDTSPDFDFSPSFASPPPAKFAALSQNATNGNGATVKPTATGSGHRTLLLATPSLASDEAALRAAMAGHDRAVSDLHMLDRLSAGLVNLPADAYDLVLLLGGGGGGSEPADAFLDRALLTMVHDALRAGGRIEAQGGAGIGPALDKEFVLAGLVRSGAGFAKPDYGAETVVPLKLRRKKKLQVAVDSDDAVPQLVAAEEQRKAQEAAAAAAAAQEQAKKVPAGVGFVTLDDLDADDDDDLIDEDTLLTAQDLKRPLNIRKPPSPLWTLECLFFRHAFPSFAFLFRAIGPSRLISPLSRTHQTSTEKTLKLERNIRGLTFIFSLF